MSEAFAGKRGDEIVRQIAAGQGLLGWGFLGIYIKLSTPISGMMNATRPKSKAARKISENGRA